jgi:hypothetical protein
MTKYVVVRKDTEEPLKIPRESRTGAIIDRFHIETECEIDGDLMDIKAITEEEAARILREMRGEP